MNKNIFLLQLYREIDKQNMQSVNYLLCLPMFKSSSDEVDIAVSKEYRYL